MGLPRKVETVLLSVLLKPPFSVASDKTWAATPLETMLVVPEELGDDAGLEHHFDRFQLPA